MVIIIIIIIICGQLPFLKTISDSISLGVTIFVISARIVTVMFGDLCIPGMNDC
jgi:hypothetical protein